jgi:VanZ family protein
VKPRGWLWIWGPVIVQMAVIFAFSSISDLPPLPGGISDKSGHSIGYALLGAFLLRALAGGRLAGVTWRRAVAAVLLAALYGVSDEFHQSFVPGRSPDVHDVAADGLGALGAAAVGALVAAARRWGILDISSRPQKRS